MDTSWIPGGIICTGILIVLILFLTFTSIGRKRVKPTSQAFREHDEWLKQQAKEAKEKAEKEEKERRGPDIITSVTQSPVGKILIVLTVIFLVFCGYVYFLIQWNEPLPEFDASRTGDTIICAPSGAKAQITADPVNGPWTITNYQCLVVNSGKYWSVNFDGTLLWQVEDTGTGQIFYTDGKYHTEVRPYYLSTAQPTPVTP